MPEIPLPQSLWGRELRTACLALVLFDGGAWSPARLRGALCSRGFADPGAKVLGDALGHEVAKGRLVRVSRGSYTLGRVPARTRRRIRARLRSTPRYPSNLGAWPKPDGPIPA